MKIAWCEQSGLIQDRQFLKDELLSNGIDFYRYNWKYDSKDVHANVFADSNTKLSWSKGRELLYYAALENDYDYFIFVDDDLGFDCGISRALKIIISTLSEYVPSILTIRSDKWHEQRLKWFTKPVVFAFIVDLQFQCIDRNTARNTFPVKFDGGWGTLWYPMLWCDKKRKPVITVRSMLLKNLNSTIDGNYGGIENRNSADIWRRSSAFMSFHARLLSKFIGFRKTIIWLNFVYALLLTPKPVSRKF